jgi:hypothetical protein
MVLYAACYRGVPSCYLLDGYRFCGGLAVGTALTSGNGNPGPIDFVPLEEGAARQAIAELRLAE